MVKQIAKYELMITLIGIFLGFGVVMAPFLVYDFSTKGETTMGFGIVVYTPISIVVGAPLMGVVLMKYRKLEKTPPSRLTNLYASGRAANQCTLCKKHPVSKKYHINKEHGLTNVDVNSYFKDCGCGICQAFNNYGN